MFAVTWAKRSAGGYWADNRAGRAYVIAVRGVGGQKAELFVVEDREVVAKASGTCADLKRLAQAYEANPYSHRAEIPRIERAGNLIQVLDPYAKFHDYWALIADTGVRYDHPTNTPQEAQP